MNLRHGLLAALIAGVAAGSVPVMAQRPSNTSFTYQGQLKIADVPVSGLSDMIFELWSEEMGGNLNGRVAVSNVEVRNGLFQVDLDFGMLSLGEKPGWLEITVEFPSGAGNWTTLRPRQLITTAPFAMTSLATVGVDGHSLDAADGSPSNVVYVDNIGRIRLGRNAALNRAVNVRGGLEVIDDNGAGVSEGIGLTSDVFQFRNLTGGTRIWNYDQATDAHNFYTGSEAVRLSIGSAGNVGVGTDTPSERLHVDGGDLRVDGDLLLYSGSTLALDTRNSTTGKILRFSNTATGGAIIDGGASGTDGAAYIALRNREGTVTTVEIDSDGDDLSNAATVGYLKLRSTGGGPGGQIVVANDSGTTGIQAVGGATGDGGVVTLYNNAGDQTILLDGHDSGDGSITLSDAAGNAGIRLRSDHAASVAGEVSVFNDAGIETVEIVGAEAATNNGGQVTIRKADGTTTIQLDGEYGSGNGYVSVTGGSTDPAIRAVGTGKGRNDATLRVHNSEPDQGMAAYLTNSSTYATMHVKNDGTGETLWLENNGGGHLIVARDAARWQFWIDGEGVTNTRVVRIHGGADLSEGFDVHQPMVEDGPTDPAIGSKPLPGMVVSIDPNSPGKLIVADQAYDRRVAGIISGAGGVNPGMLMGQDGSAADGEYPVALTGRVYCLCDASSGAIEPGDLLTTSDTPGHAMKVAAHAQASGAILGKAMTRLALGEKGLVLVLVSLQ